MGFSWGRVYGLGFLKGFGINGVLSKGDSGRGPTAHGLGWGSGTFWGLGLRVSQAFGPKVGEKVQICRSGRVVYQDYRIYGHLVLDPMVIITVTAHI